VSHRLSHTGSFVVVTAALSMFVSCGIPTMKQASMNRTEAIARVKQLAQDTARDSAGSADHSTPRRPDRRRLHG
jgi:hypothetical protein